MEDQKRCEECLMHSGVAKAISTLETDVKDNKAAIEDKVSMKIFTLQITVLIVLFAAIFGMAMKANSKADEIGTSVKLIQQKLGAEIGGK